MREYAAGISEAVLRDALENTMANPDLTLGEREVSLTTVAARDVFDVHVEVPSLCRRFLLHPEFTVSQLSVLSRDGVTHPVEVEHYDGDRVVGVQGQIPVGAVKVSGRARSTQAWSPVVSDSVLDGDPREDGDGDA